MMQEQRFRIFVVSSPSGGGKTTLVQKLLAGNDHLTYSISATTRQPRQGERHGMDYLFMSEGAFREGIRQNAFLEWAEVHGHLYGTLKRSVQELLEQGRSVILDIDVQGGIQIKNMYPEAVLIFIMPPSLEVLESRLKGRGTDTPETIARRLHVAQQEIKMADRYDYVVLNHELNTAFRELAHIVQSETEGEP